MTAPSLPDDDATVPGTVPIEPASPSETTSPVEHALATLTPRRERTRARLLDAAYTVFARDGINGASIEVICEAAGFTRGAFYSNFASKVELFLALADRITRHQLDALEAATHTLAPGDFGSGTVDQNAIAHVLDAISADDPDRARQWTLLQAELELLAMRDAEVAELYSAHEAAVRREVTDVIARILRTLGLRFVVDDDTAIELLFAAHEASSRRQASARPRVPSVTAGPPANQPGPESDPLSELVGLLVRAED